MIELANEIGVTPGAVAIAWVAGKGSLPIIGPRTLAQLEQNLEAAKVTLTREQTARLDKVSAIAPPFPQRMLENPETQQNYSGGKFDQIDLAPAGVA